MPNGAEEGQKRAHTYFRKPSHILSLSGPGTREAFSLGDHQDADVDRGSKYHASMFQ